MNERTLSCLGYIYIGDEILPMLCGDYFLIITHVMWGLFFDTP